MVTGLISGHRLLGADQRNSRRRHFQRVAAHQDNGHDPDAAVGLPHNRHRIYVPGTSFSDLESTLVATETSVKVKTVGTLVWASSRSGQDPGLHHRRFGRHRRRRTRRVKCDVHRQQAGHGGHRPGAHQGHLLLVPVPPGVARTTTPIGQLVHTAGTSTPTVPEFTDGASKTLQVASGATAGTVVGSVPATDADGDTLEYSLTGGQLRAVRDRRLGSDHGGVGTDARRCRHLLDHRAGDRRRGRRRDARDRHQDHRRHHRADHQRIVAAQTPAVPTGLTVTQTELGGSLDVSWTGGTTGVQAVSDYDIRFYAGAADPDPGRTSTTGSRPTRPTWAATTTWAPPPRPPSPASRPAPPTGCRCGPPTAPAPAPGRHRPPPPPSPPLPPTTPRRCSRR